MAKLQLSPARAAKKRPNAAELEGLWARHHGQWRDAAQVTSQWQEANDTDPELLRHRVRGRFWETLADLGLTLLITREYEHLVMAASVDGDRPSLSFMRMPHPSGLAVDRKQSVVHVASTRNPNQVFDLKPAVDFTDRLDVRPESLPGNPLVPVVSRYYPGCLYMHDLAMVGGSLYANAVGQNAVVRLTEDSSYDREWWPACIETEEGTVFGQNHIQLNSIAAGSDLRQSYFSASSDHISKRRPGHKNYPVDRRGVIFSGETREVFARGLTRPHSARLHEGRVWVDNSGYGELGFAEDGEFRPAVKLPGWTRGLCFYEGVAFVGTSRVIPRFAQYAPGLDVGGSICGVHAVDVRSGDVLGSLIWPSGNQIFAIDWLPSALSLGFPFNANRRMEREKLLFYTFSIKGSTNGVKE